MVPCNYVILVAPQSAFGFSRVVVTPLVWAGGWGVSMEMSFLPDTEPVGLPDWPETGPTLFCLAVASSSEHQKVMEGKPRVQILIETPPSYLQEA